MEEARSEAIDAYYENYLSGEARSLFDKIGFLNLGYWKGVEGSIELAQINLIETLCEFLTHRTGTLLDVGCGKGASTKYLTKYFDPKKITGINISARQIEICRIVAPECHFKVMDAAHLEFNEAHFDNVLCIEAGLHFFTRRTFFEEAHRVLKPGGRVAMLDFLCHYDALDGPSLRTLPRENYLPDLNAYKESLLEVGFKHVRVVDCTQDTVHAVTAWEIETLEKQLGNRLDEGILEKIAAARGRLAILPAGCLVFAIK